MAWDEARARREAAARAKAADAPDAQATEPLPAAGQAPADDPAGHPRWWTVRPVARHGWKVAAALAAVAILVSGVALLDGRDGHGAHGARDRGAQAAPPGDHGDGRGWGAGPGGGRQGRDDVGRHR